MAFRLESHNLAKRLPRGSEIQAAGVCGMQNTPPGAAELSLHARVSECAPGGVQGMLTEKKSLLQGWSLRVAPHIFPTVDAAVFSIGLLPEDEDDTRGFITGVQSALEKIDMSVLRLVELTTTELSDILDHRGATKDELGRTLALHIEAHLNTAQLKVWRSPSYYAESQTLGESVARFILPLAALHGVCCHAERIRNQAYIRRKDQWLGFPMPAVDATSARAELARRYVHAYGPSTPQHFAQWAGITEHQANKSWTLIESDLAQVEYSDTESVTRRAWLLSSDLHQLRSPAASYGARLLPPHDPLLQLRDRGNMVADRAMQRKIWRSTGRPGVILFDGDFCGLWHSQKKGRILRLTIDTSAGASKEIRAAIEAEANTLAILGGLRSAEICFESGP